MLVVHFAFEFPSLFICIIIPRLSIVRKSKQSWIASSACCSNLYWFRLYSTAKIAFLLLENFERNIPERDWLREENFQFSSFLKDSIFKWFLSMVESIKYSYFNDVGKIHSCHKDENQQSRQPSDMNRVTSLGVLKPKQNNNEERK